MSRGRPKGYNPYTEISYEELEDWVGKKTRIVVCKKWLASLGYQHLEDEDSEYEQVVETEQIKEEDKISFTLTDLNNE